MILFPLLIFVVSTLWLYGFWRANDLSVSSKSLADISSQFKNALVVFPHADDEAMSCAGLMSILAKSGTHVHWLILTRGEKGNEDAHYDEQLKKIRTMEAEKNATVYAASLTFADLPDDGVKGQVEELEKIIKNELIKIQPDLVITFDQAGLYGHPDHIAVSQTTTALIKREFNKTRLWYVSYPKKVLDEVALPEYMATDTHFKTHRVYPNFRVWVGMQGVLSKISAVYNYRSQRDSYMKSFPFKFIPLWFYISLTPYEYFHEVN